MATPDDVERARATLMQLEGKTLDEAAQTYLFGVLDVDVAADVDERWRDSLPVDSEREDAQQTLDRVAADPERQELLRLAMLSTLDERPDTGQLFVDSVEQAGQSMFIAELAAVTLAAALLLREHYRKGRTREVHRTETTDAEGRRVVEEHEVEYVSDGPLAQLLAQLGVGGGP